MEATQPPTPTNRAEADRAPARWWLAPLAIGSPLAVTQLALTLAGTPGTDFADAASQALITAALAFMIAGFMAAAARSAGAARRAWRWLAAGAIVYLSGELAWAVQTVVSGEPDGASIADLLWLCAYPLYFVALHIRSRGPDRTPAHGEGVIESLIVMGAFGIVLWESVLDHAINPDGTLEAAIAVAYPAADLGLLWLVLRNVYRSRVRWNAERALLACGFVAQVIADTLWALPGGDPAAPYADPFYVISAVTLGGAGFAAARAPSSRPDGRPAASRPLLLELMPYVAGVAVAFVPIWQIAQGQQELDIAVAGVAVLILVFVRLAMTVRQNRLMRERAERAALIDELTGLRNHRYFQERLHEEIERARRAGSTVGLVMIDIDRFKDVNDTVGHLAGDRLLHELGGALREACRPSDTACRIGGDELAVIVPGVSGEALGAVAARILEATARVRLPDGINGDVVTASLSIGGCVYPDQACDATSLIENADIALYRSKREGRARATIYTPELAGEASQNQALAAAEHEIRARELDFRTMFDVAHEALTIVGGDGRVVSANPAAGALFGMPAAQLSGRSIAELVSGPGAAALAAALADGNASGYTEGEYSFDDPAAGARTIEYSVTRFSAARHLFVLRDVTERRAAVRAAAAAAASSS